MREKMDKEACVLMTVFFLVIVIWKGIAVYMAGGDLSVIIN